MAKGSDNKAKGRRAYLNDIRPNLAGEYVYVGNYYCYVPKGKSFRRALAEIIALSLLSLAGLVAAGFVRAGGMANCVYVIVPYMAEAIAVFTMLWAVCKLLFKGRRLREYVYGSSVAKLPVRTVCSASFAGLGLLCIIIFSAINGIDGSIGEFVLLLLAKAVAIAAPLLLRKLINSLSWEIDA